MTQPLYSAIDLTGIRSQLIEEFDGELNIPIPVQFTHETISSFNVRDVTGDNINEILSFCDFLLLDDTWQFITCNMSANYKYVLNELHKLHYTLPDKINSNMTCDEMIEYGLLKYLIFYKDDFTQKNKLCTKACEFGQLNILIWLHNNNCSWNEWTCQEAALNGHFDCLKYAIDNNCPMDMWTCRSAAKNGHFDCLKYARENGCPWDEWVIEYARKYEHNDCLQYAIDNGCPSF